MLLTLKVRLIPLPLDFHFSSIQINVRSFFATAVHTILEDLLPKNVYFRFNPSLKSDIPLDEGQQDELNKLIMDAEHYLQANEKEFQGAAEALSFEKGVFQRWKESLGDNHLLPMV